MQAMSCLRSSPCDIASMPLSMVSCEKRHWRSTGRMRPTVPAIWKGNHHSSKRWWATPKSKPSSRCLRSRRPSDHMGSKTTTARASSVQPLLSGTKPRAAAIKCTLHLACQTQVPQGAGDGPCRAPMLKRDHNRSLL